MPADVSNEWSFSGQVAIQSDLRYLPWLRNFLRASVDTSGASLSQSGVWRASLALIEAVNNAIIHAHRRDLDQWVDVGVRLNGTRLEMTVSDAGPRFDLPAPRSPETGRTGGRGLFLIHSLCHQVGLVRRHGRNTLTMTYDEEKARTMMDQFDYEALQALHRLSAAIVQSPTLEVVCEKILHEAIKMIPVESASILRYDPEAKVLRIVAARGLSPSVMREARIAVGEGVSGSVFASSQPLLMTDVHEHPKASRRSRYQSRSAVSLPVAALPLQMEGRPLGVINMTDKSDGTSFSKRDLALLETLANQAAAYMHLCTMAGEIATARAAERELVIARQIQSTLLPNGTARLRGLSGAGICQPAASVGGDYFDYFTTAAGHSGAVVADVTGHNVGSALTMASLRSTLRSQLAQQPCSLATLLQQLNQQLYPDLYRAEQNISAALLWYDRKAGHLHYATAGHPAPLLCRKGRVKSLDAARGDLLGIAQTGEFAEAVVEAKPGDLICLYTDGLTGLRNSRGASFGLKRLGRSLSKQAAGTPKQIVQVIAQAAADFSGGLPAADDLTVVVLKVK